MPKPRPPRKLEKTATAQPTTPSDMAKVVGKICDLLEPYTQTERQKIVDTVTTLTMASRPVATTNTSPTQARPPTPFDSAAHFAALGPRPTAVR